MSSARCIGRFVTQIVRSSRNNKKINGIVIYHIVANKEKDASTSKPREEHLVLVQQGVNPGERILIFGIKAAVYVNHLSQVLVHLSKVDSTGYDIKLEHSPESGGLFHNVLSGFVYSIYKGLNGAVFYVNVCSRHNPEYIFTRSSYNSKKHIIKDGKLISWWVRALNTISNALEIVSDNEVSRHLYVPAEERKSIVRYCGHESSLKWKWGYPSLYNSEDPVENWLPLFEDDPKTKAMKLKKGMRIRDLYRHLAIVDSCFFREIGFLILSTESKFNNSKTTTNPSKSNRLYRPDVYRDISVILTNSDFSTRSEAINSTNKVAEFIETITCKLDVPKGAVSYEIVSEQDDDHDNIVSLASRTQKKRKFTQIEDLETD